MYKFQFKSIVVAFIFLFSAVLPAQTTTEELIQTETEDLDVITEVDPILNQEAEPKEESAGLPVQDTVDADDASATETDAPDLKNLKRRSRATQLIIQHASYEELFFLLRDVGLEARGSKAQMQARLYEYYKLDPPIEDSESNEGIEVVIDTAENVATFAIEEIDDDYIRLSGGIILTLIDNTTKQRHSIAADSLLLNKNSRYMTATGSVRYELQRPNSDGPEVFEGDTITINIDSWEGVFIDGISEIDQTIDGKAVTMVFYGDTVVRSSRNAVTFSDVDITTGSNLEEGYFSIHVKKLWLLASDEWAVLNPVVRVGHVPLIWFPFYFQPGDRLFFRPVLGIHSAYGPYIQTTTYLFGNPSEESGATFSLLQIDATSKTDREIDGLFLRPKKKTSGETDPKKQSIREIAEERNWLLKFYLDGYARRGIFLGLTGTFHNLASIESEDGRMTYAAIDSLSIDNYYAFTRTLFSPGIGAYTNLIPYNGVMQDHWDSGNLFNLEIPFRFMVDLAANITLFNLRFDVLFELYSDTTIGTEFLNRSEVFSWDFALGRQTPLESISSRSRTEWSIRTSYNFNRLPFTGKAAEVWDIVNQLASINLRNFEILFISGAKNKQASDISGILNAATITRGVDQSFYAPLELIAPIIQGSISGTLFSYPFPSYYTKARGSPDLESLHGQRPIEAGSLHTPWEDDANESDESSDSMGQQHPPLLQKNYTTPYFDPFTFYLSYSFNPNFEFNSVTNVDDWLRASDIDFAKLFLYQSYSLYAQLSVNYDMTFFNAMVTHSGDIFLTLRDNQLVSFDEQNGTTAERIAVTEDLFEKNDFDVQYNSLTAVYPLKQFPQLGSSSIIHSIHMLLYDEKFEYTVTPTQLISSISTRVFEWSNEFVTQHSLRMNVRLTALGILQNYSLSITLPPSDEINLSPSLSIDAGPVSVNASIQIRDLTRTVVYDPLQLGISAGFDFADGDHKITANQSFQFIVDDPDKVLDYSGTSISISLFKNILSFTNTVYVRDTYRQTYDISTSSWNPSTNTSLIVESSVHTLRIAYSPKPFWKNRITVSGSLNSTLNMNYNIFTDSYFSLNLNLSFAIYQALSISLSMSVQNTALHIYNETYATMLGINHQSFFTDLGNSLNIFDQASLQQGQFKIQGVSLRVTRTYRDWKLSFGYNGNPKIFTQNNVSVYRWDNVFSFSVTWSFLDILRTEGRYEDEVFTLVY